MAKEKGKINVFTFYGLLEATYHPTKAKDVKKANIA
jgi:hypothetical protein